MCQLYTSDKTTYLQRLFSMLSIRFLRMVTSSSSRFWFNCSATRGSHPNNLIIRMTFIATRDMECVSFSRNTEATTAWLTFSNQLYAGIGLYSRR